MPEARERVRTSARAGRECGGVDQVILAEEQKANACGPRVDVLTAHVGTACCKRSELTDGGESRGCRDCSLAPG